jgi:UDP-galactopyranose mutase
MKEPHDELMPALAKGEKESGRAVFTQSSSKTVTTADNDRSNPLGMLGMPVPDLVCFSHLRWNFVFQRPQHIMTRFMRHTRVFFVEEPYWDGTPGGEWLEVQNPEKNLWVVIPHLPGGMDREDQEKGVEQLLQPLFTQQKIESFIAWYYTPMALGFTQTLKPLVIVYDCMDELSAFRGAPPILLDREKELFQKADLVFTGGQSLYEAKRERHSSVHAFPSSIEQEHFAQARQPQSDPEDQAAIPYPRFGFYGVLDERFDIELLGGIATARPDWHFVMLGPVVKISHEELPQGPNIHYLGMKTYPELPKYLSGWDVALLLFAMNESTRFISPTKTPEYLAAGKPVVSTPIRDVVRPYGDEGLVHIAADVAQLEEAISKALEERDNKERQATVDAFLKQNSWDITWHKMATLIGAAIHVKSSSKN